MIAPRLEEALGPHLPIQLLPVFETLAGWNEDLTGTALPDAATDYVSFVADALDVPVTLVGTGASRDAVLALQP